MLWQQIDLPDCVGGFPSQPAALATANLGSGEFLAAVGGVIGYDRHLPPSREFDELVAAEGEAPLDLWTASGAGAGEGAPAWSFSKCVLAFSPKPRCGFSLTPLDGDGSRFLLFGGRTGRRGTVGHCLSDLAVLELNAGGGGATSSGGGPLLCARDIGKPDSASGSSEPTTAEGGARGRSPSTSSSDVEAEEIFFAHDYRASLSIAAAAGVASIRKASSPKPSASALATSGRPFGAPTGSGRCLAANDASDDDEEEDSQQASGDITELASMLFRKAAGAPLTYTDVLSQLGNNQSIAMTRRSPRLAKDADREEVDNAVPSSRIGPRWRVPQVLSDTPLRARAGHSGVLQTPLTEGEDPVVLIYGGLTDGGLPLGDTYRVKVSLGQSPRRAMECTWACADEGGSLNCETAPWEQQEKPRPRACHSAVFWPGAGHRCMVVFGGLGLGCEGEPRAYGDTWTFVIGSSAAGQFGRWKRPLMQGGAPSRRWGHGACLLGGSSGSGFSMLVCGGVDASGNSISDCWVLDLEEMRWDAVEMCSSQLLLGRSSLLKLGGSVSASSGAMRAPTDIGRCSVFWSGAHDLAIVWGGCGVWAWHEPEQLRSRRHGRMHRAELPAADSAEGEAVGTASRTEDEEQHRRRTRSGKKRRKKKTGGLEDTAAMELEVQDEWTLETPRANPHQPMTEAMAAPRFSSKGPERPPLCPPGDRGAARELPEVQMYRSAPMRLPSVGDRPPIGAASPDRASTAELPGVMPPARRRAPPGVAGLRAGGGSPHEHGAGGPAPDLGGSWASSINPTGARAKMRPPLSDPPSGFLPGRMRGETRRPASRLDLGPVPESRSGTPIRTESPRRLPPQIAARRLDSFWGGNGLL